MSARGSGGKTGYVDGNARKPVPSGTTEVGGVMIAVREGGKACDSPLRGRWWDCTEYFR